MKKTNRYLIVRDFEKAVKNDMAAACRLKSWISESTKTQLYKGFTLQKESHKTVETLLLQWMVVERTACNECRENASHVINQLWIMLFGTEKRK